MNLHGKTFHLAVFMLAVSLLAFSPELSAKKKKIKPTAQEKELQTAVLQNNKQKVIDLLDAGVNVNAQALSGESMLATATYAGYVDMVNVLLEKGADPNFADSPALFYAKKADVVNALIKGGANVNVLRDGRTAFLHWMDMFATLPTQAEKNQALAVVRQQNLGEAALKMVEASFTTKQDLQNVVNAYKTAGYDFDKQYTEVKVNALLEAALTNNFALVEILLNAGVQGNLQDNAGQTALLILTRNEQITQAEYDKLAALLYKNKADFNLPDAEPYTPLYAAALAGSLGKCKTLVKYGADVNKTCKNDFTPLFASDRLDITTFLVSKGANVKAVSVWNTTPLFAVTNLDMLNYLVSKGVKVNHVDNEGDNILTANVSHIHTQGVEGNDVQDAYLPKIKWLIKKGIDVNHTGKQGTALHIAQLNPDEKIVAALVAGGAK